VQMATFGSEFVAARIRSYLIELHYDTFEYLLRDIPSYIVTIADLLDNSTIPHSRLNKRRITLSYHRDQEAICANIMTFVWLDSKHNPADILSKHWSRQTVCDLLHSLLFKTSSVKESLDLLLILTDPIGQGTNLPT
jgi:ATP-dependent helicase/DNAse subunit B